MSKRIEIKNLTKTFGKNKNESIGLNDITLTLEPNKLIGLIGPNGAGKSTLLKIIAKQLHPTSGKVSVQDSVCYANNFEPIYTLHKIHTLFELSKSYYKNWSDEIATDLINYFSIDTSKRYTKLSKGQQGLINIIIGFASNAQITLFDESHIALDAVMRQKFLDLLLDFYTSTERTFILSTHYINEASNLFEDIVIINEGKLLLHTTKDAIEEKAVSITGDFDTACRILDSDHIINTNKLASIGEFHYFGPISSTLRHTLDDMNFKVIRTPLETFFINLLGQEGSYE